MEAVFDVFRASQGAGRYLETFLECVAPSWLSISPWRAMATRFRPWELSGHNTGVVWVYGNQRAQNARGWAGVLALARGGAHFEHVDFGKSFSAIESPCQGPI